MLSANQISVIKAQAYAGYPSQFSDVCKVYPTMMKDYLQEGEISFSGRLGLLLLTEVDISNMGKERLGKEIPINEIHVLEFLLNNANKDDGFFLELTNAFSTFIKEEITLLPKINSVLVGPPIEKRLITEKNFNDFQTILRIQNRKEVPEPPPENESAIARKMRLKREEREAVKRKQQQKNGQVQELADLLEISEVFGIDYKEKSLYAFYGLIQRHQLKEKWDQDIATLCAGADPSKVQAKYWGESPTKN